MWGRIRRQAESASAAYDATLSSYDGVTITLIGEVAQTYLLIRTTEQRLAVARQNLAYQTESVRISQAKLEAGEISSLDVEQGQTLLHNTRASIALLDQSLKQLKVSLAVLLGQPPQDMTERLGTPRPIPARVAAAGRGHAPGSHPPPAGHPRGGAAGCGAVRADRGRGERPVPAIRADGIDWPGHVHGRRPALLRPLQRHEHRLEPRWRGELESLQLGTHQEQRPAPGCDLSAADRRLPPGRPAGPGRGRAQPDRVLPVAPAAGGPAAGGRRGTTGGRRVDRAVPGRGGGLQHRRQHVEDARRAAGSARLYSRRGGGESGRRLPLARGRLGGSPGREPWRRRSGGDQGGIEGAQQDTGATLGRTSETWRKYSHRPK